MQKGTSVGRGRLWVVLALAGAIPSYASATATFVAGPTYDGLPAPLFSAMAVGVNNAGVAVGTALAGNRLERAVRYSAAGSVELPPADGNTFSFANSVSDDGTVIGTSRSDGNSSASGNVGVYWDAGNAVHLLATPAAPAGGRVALAPQLISPAGVIVASASIYSSTSTLIANPLERYSSRDALPVELASPGGSTGSPTTFATGINRAGTLIGYALPATTQMALRWPAAGTSFEHLPDLETNPGVSTVDGSVAYGVNDAGAAVGYSTHFAGSAYGGQVAVRWSADGTSVTSLGSLDTAPINLQASSASLINAAGDIAGKSIKYDHTATTSAKSIGDYGVRWLPGSDTSIELGNLGVGSTGKVSVGVYAMNASGSIVGSSTWDGASNTHAALWTTSSNAAVDLNALIVPDANWTLTQADVISDTGWISGVGSYDPDGAGSTAAYSRLFTLLVPEAGTYGLGDANFDTHVDFADLLVLAKHYGQPSDGSNAVGDFNLDGTTDFADLLTLAKHYGGAAPIGDAAFAAEWSLAQSLVPEPGVAAVILLVAAGRRRRI